MFCTFTGQNFTVLRCINGKIDNHFTINFYVLTQNHVNKIERSGFVPPMRGKIWLNIPKVYPSFIIFSTRRCVFETHLSMLFCEKCLKSQKMSLKCTNSVMFTDSVQTWVKKGLLSIKQRRKNTEPKDFFSWKLKV